MGYQLYIFAKRIENADSFTLASFLFALSILDLFITYHVYSNYPEIFFTHEANKFFVMVVRLYGIHVAFFYSFMIDIIFIYLLRYRYKTIRGVVFYKAILHTFGLNWFLILYTDIEIWVVSFLNMMITGLFGGIPLVIFLTDDELLTDMFKAYDKLKEKLTNIMGQRNNKK